MLSYTIVFFVWRVCVKDWTVIYIIVVIKKGWNPNSLDFDHAPISTEATRAAFRLLLHPATALKAQAIYRIDIVRVWFDCSEVNLKEFEGMPKPKREHVEPVSKEKLFDWSWWSHFSDVPLFTSPGRFMLEDCQIVFTTMAQEHQKLYAIIRIPQNLESEWFLDKHRHFV